MRRLLASVLVAIGLASVTSVAAAEKGKILVVISSEDQIELQDGKTYRTGYFLNELTVPIMALTQAGYAISFANPKGNAPSMDVHSDSADFFGGNTARYQEVKAFHDQLDGLKRPLKLADVLASGLDGYSAVFFPGGHAPMNDLARSEDVRAVLAHFHRAGKPTALICHGPIALLSAMPDAQRFVAAMRAGDRSRASSISKSWPYAGYQMTIFSSAEEQTAEAKQLGGRMPFYPQDALTEAGGVVSVGKPWSSNVVRDRELITGQNPNSDEALVAALLAALATVNSN